MKSSRSEFIDIRGLRTHVRHWGPEDAPRLFLLHGWLDVSAAFQFTVDALKQDWHVIAPDWRGSICARTTRRLRTWRISIPASLTSRCPN